MAINTVKKSKGPLLSPFHTMSRSVWIARLEWPDCALWVPTLQRIGGKAISQVAGRWKWSILSKLQEVCIPHFFFWFIRKRLTHSSQLLWKVANEKKYWQQWIQMDLSSRTIMSRLQLRRFRNDSQCSANRGFMSCYLLLTTLSARCYALEFTSSTSDLSSKCFTLLHTIITCVPFQESITILTNALSGRFCFLSRSQIRNQWHDEESDRPLPVGHWRTSVQVSRSSWL